MRTLRSTLSNAAHWALLVAVALPFASCSTPRETRARPGRYSDLLHDRFYEAWVEPPRVGAERGKVSVLVDVRVARDGRVVSFKPVKLSGYPRIDRSILDVGKRVKKVPPPPIQDGEFRLRIYFELDVKRP